VRQGRGKAKRIITILALIRCSLKYYFVRKHLFWHYSLEQLINIPPILYLGVISPPKRGDALRSLAEVIYSHQRLDRIVARTYHIISIHCAKNSVLMKAASESGYNINRGSNGIWLPYNDQTAKIVNLPTHTGRHIKKYFSTVTSSLAQQVRIPVKSATHSGFNFTTYLQLPFSIIHFLKWQFSSRIISFYSPH
jgi:hypothetical protein